MCFSAFLTIFSVCEATVLFFTHGAAPLCPGLSRMQTPFHFRFARPAPFDAPVVVVTLPSLPHPPPLATIAGSPCPLGCLMHPLVVEGHTFFSCRSGIRRVAGFALSAAGSVWFPTNLFFFRSSSVPGLVNTPFACGVFRMSSAVSVAAPAPRACFDSPQVFQVRPRGPRHSR